VSTPISGLTTNGEASIFGCHVSGSPTIPVVCVAKTHWPSDRHADRDFCSARGNDGSRNFNQRPAQVSSQPLQKGLGPGRPRRLSGNA